MTDNKLYTRYNEVSDNVSIIKECVKMKKRYLAICVIILLILTSMLSIATENTNDNLYPNPQPGLGKINDQVYIYTNDKEYNYSILNINAPKMNESVIYGSGGKKSKVNIYTLTVVEEGMISINLETEDLDKHAHLYVNISMNDPRNNTIDHNPVVQTTLTAKPLSPSVERKFIFYAYPGTYYLDVNGTNESGNDYTILDYRINATQELYNVNSSGNLGNSNHPDFPNYLGSTTLTDYITINETIRMKNWATSSSGGSLYGKATNSADKFKFTANKTGTVHIKFRNIKTTILDSFLLAYHNRVNSYDYIPKLDLSVLEINKGYPLRTSCNYGQEVMDSFEVEAGVTYDVSILSTDSPMVYSIDLYYTGYEPGSQTYMTSSASNWAIPEINESITVGLQTSKMMNNDYKSYATREEFAELVMKLYDQLGGASVSSSQNPFTDTTNSEIVRAANTGIINGTSATTFGSNEYLTREQLCVMILRTLDATNTNYNKNVTFQKNYSDEDLISDWALTSVRTLNSYKIINGSGAVLDPKSTVTKEVAILMMYRAYNMFK